MLTDLRFSARALAKNPGYALVAILKKRLGSDATLYQLLQILSVSVFEKTPVAELFQSISSQNAITSPHNQLLLFA